MNQREKAQGFIQEGAREQYEGRYVPASTAFLAAGSIFEQLHAFVEAERCYRSAATVLDRAADGIARRERSKCI